MHFNNLCNTQGCTIFNCWKNKVHYQDRFFTSKICSYHLKNVFMCYKNLNLFNIVHIRRVFGFSIPYTFSQEWMNWKEGMNFCFLREKIKVWSRNSSWLSKFYAKMPQMWILYIYNFEYDDFRDIVFYSLLIKTGKYFATYSY